MRTSSCLQFQSHRRSLSKAKVTEADATKRFVSALGFVFCLQTGWEAHLLADMREKLMKRSV